KRAQGLGFSLREVQALLRLRETRGVPCAQVRGRAERKLAEIMAKERQLAAMRRALEKLVASCRTERSRRECPIWLVVPDPCRPRGHGRHTGPHRPAWAGRSNFKHPS